MAKSILILMMLLLVLCSVSAVDDDAVLETVSTESQDVIAVENIAADDANSSTVDVASEHNDVFKASGDGNVLDVSDDEGALKDSDNLKIRDSASGETETVSSSSTTVTMDIYHKSMASSYFYYIIDGTREYDVVYRTSMFDFGGDWVSEALTYTFASEGPHTIQLTTNDGGTTSNTINYVIGESSDPQGPGEASNPEAHTSPLPDYYIRFFDNDEDEFQNVQFLDGWDTLNVDMLTKLYAGDGSNSFPSSVYPGSASSTTAYGYLDGSQYGSSYILTNGTSTSYLYNYQISFSNVGSGIHTFYSTYTYNGVTYYSNVYYFYVGDAYQEYETTLNLYDKNNPEGGASYKVGDTITILNSLTNSILGSDIGNYIFTRTSDGNDYVLENIDLSLNGEPLYQHGNGSLYAKNGEGLLVNPNGASSSGYTLTFDHEGWYNFTAKYYGNELGLKESTATLNLYVGSDSTPLETSIVIELNSSSVSNNTAITVAPSIQDENGNAVEEGTVVFYNNETGDEIGRINLEDSQTFSFTSSGDAGSHGIYAKYLANDALSESTSDVESYKIKGTVVLTIARVGDDVVIAPDTTVYFTVDAAGLTEGLALYIGDAELWDEDGSDTSITFDSSDIGENNVTLRFAGNDDYEAAVSNIVTINVVQPVATSISLELNSSELTNSNKILVTPHVFDSEGKEIDAGTVKVYTTSSFSYADPIITVNAGESFNLTSELIGNNEFNVYSNPHKLYSQYVGATTADGIYANSQNTTGTQYLCLYSTTLTLTVNDGAEATVHVGESVDFKAVSSSEGNGVITLNNGTELVNGVVSSFVFDSVGDYTFHAIYTRNENDYYSGASSGDVTVHVIALSGTSVSLSLDSTSISKGDSIVATPVVKDADNNPIEKGTVVLYDNETGVEIARIDLEENQTIEFTPTGDAGSYGIYAKYLANEALGYSEGISAIESYKIKGTVVLTIARVGEDVVIAPDTTVYFTVDAAGLTEGLALYIGDTELWNEDGSDTSIKFDSSDIGENNVTLRFAGNDDYEAAVSNIVTINVVQPVATSISLELNTTELFNDDYILITPHVFDADDNEINVGNVTVYFDNAYFYSDPIAKIALGESANFTDDKFSAGRHYFYAKYSGASSGNVIYAASEAGEGKGTSFDELYRSTLVLSVENDTVCTGGTVQFNLAGTCGNGELTFSNGDSFDAITLNLDTVGDYTFYVIYTRGTDYYASAVSNEVVIHVIAKKETINESDFSYSVEKGSVVVSLPSDATGNVSVVVGEENFTSEVKDGQAVVDVSALGSGNHSMVISYSGDDKYDGISVDAGSVEVKVPVKINESDFSYSVEGSNVVVSLPSDATGNVTVTVNNKTFTAKVENGKAVVDLSSLEDGSYSMAISYSGDDKYDGISANASGVDVKNLAKLTGSNVKAFYDSGSYFKVRVYGVDGKVAGAGEKVSITLNGKKYNVKTDAKGYAKVKIALKSGSYKAVALYKGFKLTKKVTVKTVIKAKKTTKVKKSAKSLKIKIKLKGKKVLKKKSLKVKFKGKTYRLKTNKKGIAYFKVKKSVIKKLKKGKKYSFKITYKKDVLKRYLKVKK